jgi:hypothetical protein
MGRVLDRDSSAWVKNLNASQVIDDNCNSSIES